MAEDLEGVITIVQEGRFQLIDDAGIGHLFILGRAAAAEPAQLPSLQRSQARVRVRYIAAGDIIGNVALAVSRVGAEPR